ncbi:hypothetical protein QFC22_001134 [Naganishia vaughanmartiniae]|uniref:Uncharacterized protein n=1 Tax=Naganishia vaughanmartiniae TaxID=1424756 RepID=A0ACC2XLW1_9TREE|nr:hypothetical protein QFC22_001134 [Naganishia vaughanmartiniae]
MLPVSRLPRLNATPVKAATSVLLSNRDASDQEYPLSHLDLVPADSRKRKGPDDEQEAGGAVDSTGSLVQIGIKRVANATNRMTAGRTVSGNGAGSIPFVPQPKPPSTTRKPINAIGSTTMRSTATNSAAGSRPGSSMSISSTTTTTGRRTIPNLSSAVGPRPPLSRAGSSAPTSQPGLRTMRTASNTNLRGLASSQAGSAPPTRLNRSVMGGPPIMAGGKKVSSASTNPLGRSMGPGSRARSTVMMDYENGQQELQARLNTTQNDEREARRNLSTAGEEIAAMREKHRDEVDELERKLSKKERERKELEEDCKDLRSDLESCKGEVRDLKAQLDALRATNERQQQEIANHVLTVKQAEETTARANERVREVEEDLRTAETIRRKLHNQVQELKGNIRVFARVRPPIGKEELIYWEMRGRINDDRDVAILTGKEVSTQEDLAEIEYPVKGVVTASGQEPLTVYKSRDNAEGRNTLARSFVDLQVFQPAEGQREVFEEISMLAQSVLDGYNVCIFAYGQTGSGKSWTMEGGSNPETAGMIPRAIEMIFKETQALKELGWQYAMTGQFVEIYNERINDLFGDDSFDSAKHEIKHEGASTSVTGIIPCPLESADQVARLMARASGRRAVAATMMNERSSRSHSVFSLKVRGYNPLTSETCEGVLNLVDLAGSERLDKAGTGEHKDRMKETININKSLSSLQNVIQKLSEKATDGKTHVNYRDSQLTYLLQNSLSGKSYKSAC